MPNPPFVFPKPRFGLEVAVIGNRRFTPDHGTVVNESGGSESFPAVAEQALEEVWALIGEQMLLAKEISFEVEYPPPRGRPAIEGKKEQVWITEFFEVGHPRIGVLSSLAAGADQAGARSALAVAGRSWQGKLELQLEAILPFHEEDYPGLPGSLRKEFTQEEAEEHWRLLEQCRQIVRLDACYELPAAMMPTEADAAMRKKLRDDARHQAYRDARDMSLENSDLLLAVYDPTAPTGSGGTMETVKLALEIGMPVIAILVRAGEVRIAVYRQANDRPHANRAWAEASEVAPEKAPWRSGAKDVIQYLLAFPHSISGPDQRHDYERRKSLTSAVKRLRLLQNSELYLSKLAKSDLSLRMFQLPWVKIQEMASLWSSKHAFEKPDVPAPGNFQNVSRMKRLKSLMFIGWSLRRKARSSKPRVTVKPYATIYSEASNLAGKLMTIYRGGFVAAFIFAALASLVAVIITGLALYFAKGPPGSESHPWLPLVVGLGVLKIVIIGVLILLERRSEEENWQEAAADFRYLTELMQPMQYLGPLGASIPEVELPAIYTRGDPRQDWVSWLFRACSRGVPSVTVPGEDGAQPEVRFSPERTREILRDARAGWLAGQIDYHKGNAVKYHWLENGLEKIGKRMLEAVIVAAVLLLVMEIVEHHWFSHVIPPGLNAAIVMLSVAVASLPAFIAALGAICFQSEAKRLEQRSEAMLWLLDARVHALNDFERAMDDGNIARSSRRLAQELRISADLVMREALEWKSLYRIHTIKAG